MSKKKVVVDSKRVVTSTTKERVLRWALVRILLKTPVREVTFRGNRISLTFFGQRISDTIRIKREDHVADWSRRRKEIFIDKKITVADRKKSFQALCVHEVIEKFLVEKFGLRLDEEAHVVATQKEKEYLQHHGGNWRSHELIIYWDWHRMGEH